MNKLFMLICQTSSEPSVTILGIGNPNFMAFFIYRTAWASDPSTLKFQCVAIPVRRSENRELGKIVRPAVA